MRIMSDTDMMSMAQGMMDYTKQSQFNNQNINNNGGFPFTNSQFPKQLSNMQALINQNNGFTSIGNGNVNKQQLPGVSNQGHSNSNAQIPQRGSDILSQPIFPSENNRFTSPNQIQSTTGNASPNARPSGRFDQNSNFNSNNNLNSGGATNNENNIQQPTVFVSSLGEISTDPNLRFNPFTTAIVSTKIFDTLPSNVDPISTTADQVQKIALNSQFNQLNDNTQPNQFQQNNGLNNLQQEINHLSVSASDESNFSQKTGAQDNNGSSRFVGTNVQTESNDQSGQTLTAVYSGSGDLLSHTIGQYGKAGSLQEPSQNVRDPSLSALVNSLGETILTPIFTGEGNLLSQTVFQKGSSQPKPDTFATAAGQGNCFAKSNLRKLFICQTLRSRLGVPVSTPQPILQTPFFSEQSRVTITPFASGSNVEQNVAKVNVVYSGEGNLLSQTIGQKKLQGQSQQLANGKSSTSTNTGAVKSEESNTSSRRIQQQNGQTTSPSQVDQKQTISFGTSKSAGEQKSFINQRTSIGTSSSVTQTTQSIPSTQSFGQRVTDQIKQQSSTSNLRPNVANQFSSFGQTRTYNNQVSFGQKLSTNPAPTTSTTTIPYSPSVPPFRSTTTTTYTPTATSYHQHTQAYNGQSHQSRSFTQHDNDQSSFSHNQLQVPSKEYLPGAARTARTNELAFGNHGSSTFKSSSSQNFARNDGRQQFTYPVDQVI